jgi:putative heme-binding domain-containing protein
MNRIALAVVCSLALCLSGSTGHAGERPYGIPKRVPWTTSHITGSPEPPTPYKVERVFPKLTFKNPLLLANAPGTDRLFVGEQAGKLYSFRKPSDHADLFFDLTTELHSWDPKSNVRGVGALYGLTFHPQFAKTRYCYICYVLDSKKEGEQLPDGSRVSRFRVTEADPPRVDPKSEKILLSFMAGGHNGGDLHFGPDGCLYISTGDAADPNPPDRFDTGQDLSDLLSSILRIDVDHEDKGKLYRVPADNPFVKLPGARPEIWAYGFRNPWRMSFDRQSGDLWVGDVGWELWEMVYRVRRGGNYGWSVMEGPQPVRPDSKHGPTPILPPALAFPHSEAASITGGYVYRGKQHRDLVGAYICGDWVTRKLWGTRFDSDDHITSHQELARTTQRIVAFGEDNEGELYYLNYDDAGGIYQLVPNEAAKDYRANFPKKLSDTGLFTSVSGHETAAGVLPFSVNVAQWADHATAERFVALPGTSTVRIYDTPISIPETFYSGQIFFPKDGVLARTVSLEMERGNPRTRRRLETQILHFDGSAWHGYTYQWNDEQTDAVLVPAAGAERTLTIVDPQSPGGKRKQTWHFPSRAECMQCHNPWVGYTLAFTPPQLNCDHDYAGIVDNQLRTLQHIGIYADLHNENNRDKPGWQKPAGRLVNPHDSSGDLNARARSYLHVNCSHCHQFGAGGTADFDVRHDFPLEQTKTLDVRPVQGAFGIPDARILAGGDPYRSVLYYRISKIGRGRMPHIGSEIVDDRGVRLIQDWIRQLPIRRDEKTLVEKLAQLDDTAITAAEQQRFAEQVKQAALTIARSSGRESVIPEDRQRAEIELRARTSAQQKARAGERRELIRRLLASTSSALVLAEAINENRMPNAIRQEILAGAVQSEPQVRDLFERFLPDEQRVKRLGMMIRPEQILSLKGDAGRGKELFKIAGLQCINCHRVGNTGSTLGPDLTQIGKKYTRGQILENILDPSKTIEPKYVTYVVETADGQVHTGILAERNDREVVIRTVADKEIRIPAKKVETVLPQKKSIMPEQLMRDLTAEQAADLLEFLASLK